jgi:hypothetical protein
MAGRCRPLPEAQLGEVQRPSKDNPGAGHARVELLPPLLESNADWYASKHPSTVQPA